MANIPESPDLRVAVMGIAVVGGFVVYRLIQWVREASPTPDPWDAKTEEDIQKPDIIQVCHRCSTPHSPTQWFCEHCGAAVGDYNNVMPYVDVFSQGEVLQNGTHDRMRKKPLIIIGYLLYTFSAFTLLAPVYWIFLFKNLYRHRDDDTDAGPSERAANPS
jgi:hypothetical protein